MNLSLTSIWEKAEKTNRERGKNYEWQINAIWYTVYNQSELVGKN